MILLRDYSKEIHKPTFYFDPNSSILNFNGEPYFEITPRAIPNITPKKFYVSVNGVIYNSTTHKFSTGHVNQRGYVDVELTDFNNKRIHTSMHNVIERVFDWFPGCESMEVNHINGIHNDNRRDNLELITHKENMEHAYATGLNCNYGENHKDVTVTEAQIRQVCELLQDRPDLTYPQVSEITGVSRMIVTQIHAGLAWTRVSSEYNFPDRNYSKFSEEIVHEMCKIFVRMKGQNHLDIFKQVAKELGITYTQNFRNKMLFIYYKKQGHFVHITDQYDYL